jgi:selenocysteine-specific elongation factor
MTEKHFILATAGHVDHGKSALVKALTGTDPDRLPEEKARGITIDLGFAELNLNGPNQQKFRIGIVDVPGHEDFVRNMIAGVGSVDLALLVVAVDDRWMPQTEEHLQVLTYLGVKSAVIALTKTDLANSANRTDSSFGEIDNVVAQIRDELLDSPFANSQIIPTSVRTGEGIENLKRALVSEFATLPPPCDIGKPRLFVDRAFTLRGIGTVVTGTLTGGQFLRSQNVVVHPKNLSARVRSIQSHGRELEVAAPGMRAAINLPDFAVGTGAQSVQRGDVITIADVAAATATLDLLLEKSSRLSRENPAARPLKNGASVYVHHGTVRVLAKILFLDNAVLGCGEHAIAQLRLESPILAFLGDRFVIRDPSEQFTIGGGIILQPNGDRKNFRCAAQRGLLEARVTAAHDVDVCIRSELACYGLAQSRTLLAKSNFSADKVAETLIRLQNRGAIVLLDNIAADVDAWRTLSRRASALIDNAHEQHPEQRGLELVELRAALCEQSDDVFEVLTFDLCANGFTRERSTIARRSHRAKLPEQIQSAAENIRAALSVKPFDPPARKEIAKNRHLQQALRFLIEQNEAAEIGPDVVLLREAADEMKSKISGFISRNGPATVSELRQELGTSRRIIIPFLEYLDRCGVTQREGDRRKLRDQQSVFSDANLLK